MPTKYLFILLTAAICIFCPYSLAHSRDEATVNIELELQENSLQGVLTLSPTTLIILAHKDTLNYIPATVSTENIDQERVLSFLKDNIKVEIDDILVQPLFIDKQLSVDGEPISKTIFKESWYAQIFVNYPLFSEPESISITCQNEQFYETLNMLCESLNEYVPADQPLNKPLITGQLYSNGIKKVFYLTKDSPQYKANKPDDNSNNQLELSKISRDQFDNIQRNKSVALYALCGIFALIATRLIQSENSKQAFKQLTIILAFAISISSGIYGYVLTRQNQIPLPEKAAKIFTILHANIYRSFDYQNESDIYDSLSQSVSGPILSEIYETVYKSLVLQDQDGAVCSIDNINMLSTEFIPPANNESIHYKIKCQWQVDGLVSHWGHVHQRTNEYSAIYTVTAVDNHWRITDSKVTSQHRVEP